MSYDTIVIGAGHNGLTAAGLLARGGRRVLVVERRGEVGGLASSTEFNPGYRTAGILHDTTGVRASVIKDLDLEKHGLRRRSEPVPVFLPERKGTGLLLHRDPSKAAPEINSFSARDADRYAKYQAFHSRLGRFLLPLLNGPSPPVAGNDRSDFWGMIKAGMNMRRLGRKEMIEFLRLAPMPLRDWMEESFETPLLQSALAAPGLSASLLGPWSPGTATGLMMYEAVRGAGIQGGAPALVRALLAACESRGVEVRLNESVSRIRLRAGVVVGVTLAGGEELDGSMVASSCDPRTTFLDLMTPRDLPLDLERGMQNFKARGNVAKVHLALTGPLAFACRPDLEPENIRIGESLVSLEKAFDCVKYGEMPVEPCLDVAVPSLSDPSLAPDGGHVVSILVYAVPPTGTLEWTDARREELGDLVVSRLASYAPELRDRIVGREVLTPLDLEREYGLNGGHLYHGEQGLDQVLFMRPVPTCAQYSTPLEGLWLCGSGSHPGGGITCGPGMIAAAAILNS